MHRNALQKLAQFHNDLYRNALEAAGPLNALSTPEIVEYSSNFHKSVPKDGEPSTIDEITKRTVEARLLLFGDFHTLAQSQKGFLQILTAAHHADPSKPISVALEIFDASDQETIDEFLSGFVTEEKFLKKINYYKKWGFPWENYRPIIQFCIKAKIPVIGINSQFQSKNRLNKRDDFAAEIITNRLTTYPNELCLCLIGEHHLADSHLLSRIPDTFSTIRIMSNIDEIALKFDASGLKANEYLRMAENVYCIINTVPWIKWQSLAMWEEIHSSSEGSLTLEEFDPYTEHQYDFDYQLLHIIKALNEFLRLGLNQSNLSQFDLHFRPDRATMHYIKNKISLHKAESIVADKRMQIDGHYYFSIGRTVVVQNFSVNRFAEIAGCFLHDVRAAHLQGQQENSLIHRVERQFCGTVSALLMNPRSEITTARSLHDYYEKVKKKKLIGESRQKREISKLILPIYHEIIEDPNSLRCLQTESIIEKDLKLDYAAGKQLGEILGAAFFQALIGAQSQYSNEAISDVFGSSLQQQLTILRNLTNGNPKMEAAS